MAAVALSLAGGEREAYAHGEPVRGLGSAGVNTTGGEVGRGVGLGLRYDWRQYSLFNDQQLLDFRRLRNEDVHQHSRESSLFFLASFGVSPSVDVSVQGSFTRFDGFADNADDYAVKNDTLSRTKVSQGLGDTLVLARYEFFSKNDHHISVLGGLKFPTGNVRQRTDNGDLVGTHNQPASGSLDTQAGFAYTGHFFGQWLGLSADVIVRANTEGAGAFRSGNSIQGDVAAALRPHAMIVPFVELNFFTQERDIERDEVKRNSGVTSLFASGGLKLAIAQAHGLFVVGSLPVFQSFPGISNNESFRIGIGYGMAFGGDDHERAHGSGMEPPGVAPPAHVPHHHAAPAPAPVNAVAPATAAPPPEAPKPAPTPAAPSGM